MNNTQQQPIDVFQIITNRIIEQLAQQIVPWRKPWTEAGHPQNLFTKRYYTGINTWLLASLGFSQNYFLTWKQVKAVGASVKKGEKGTMIVFWKRLDNQQAEDDKDEQRPKSVLRYYYVFNIAQIDHLPEVLSIPYPDHGISQIGACDEIIERMSNCPQIRHGKHVNLPKQGSFDSAESYYSTLFHELVHSTGHASRLNRKEVVELNGYGSDMYGIEELTAEIGACYLNSVAGIAGREFDNSVAYIKGWTDRLRNDRRMIIYASSQAQKATDYILNVQSYQKAEEMQLESELETQ